MSQHHKSELQGQRSQSDGEPQGQGRCGLREGAGEVWASHCGLLTPAKRYCFLSEVSYLPWSKEALCPG